MRFCVAVRGRLHHSLGRESRTQGAADKQAKLYPSQEYKIQYGDQLDIKFLYNPELNEISRSVRMGAYPADVGDIMVVDMTPTQLAETLKTKYAAEIRSLRSRSSSGSSRRRRCLSTAR